MTRRDLILIALTIGATSGCVDTRCDVERAAAFSKSYSVAKDASFERARAEASAASDREAFTRTRERLLKNGQYSFQASFLVIVGVVGFVGGFLLQYVGLWFFRRRIAAVDVDLAIGTIRPRMIDMSVVMGRRQLAGNDEPLGNEARRLS